MFSVRVMVRATSRVTLRVEVMVTVGFRIRGRVKTRTAGLTMHTGMHTIVVQQPCSPQRSTAIAIHHTRATAMHRVSSGPASFVVPQHIAVT